MCITVKILKNNKKKKNMYEYYHRYVATLFRGGKKMIVLLIFCEKLRLQKYATERQPGLILKINLIGSKIP